MTRATFRNGLIERSAAMRPYVLLFSLLVSVSCAAPASLDGAALQAESLVRPLLSSAQSKRVWSSPAAFSALSLVLLACCASTPSVHQYTWYKSLSGNDLYATTGITCCKTARRTRCGARIVGKPGNHSSA